MSGETWSVADVKFVRWLADGVNVVLERDRSIRKLERAGLIARGTGGYWRVTDEGAAWLARVKWLVEGDS